jgi:hypothetical protein
LHFAACPIISSFRVMAPVDVFRIYRLHPCHLGIGAT